MGSGRIVVGIDGSEGSERAVAWCADYAGRFGFEIVAVHAMPLPAAAWVLPYGGHASDEADGQREALDPIARTQWCAPLAEAGVKHDVLIVEGYPAWMLMDVADREDAEMIVVGSRGRGGFGELLLGSTSHSLAHHAKRPVLIVPSAPS